MTVEKRGTLPEAGGGQWPGRWAPEFPPRGWCRPSLCAAPLPRYKHDLSVRCARLGVLWRREENGIKDVSMRFTWIYFQKGSFEDFLENKCWLSWFLSLNEEAQCWLYTDETPCIWSIMNAMNWVSMVAPLGSVGTITAYRHRCHQRQQTEIFEIATLKQICVFTTSSIMDLNRYITG